MPDIFGIHTRVAEDHLRRDRGGRVLRRRRGSLIHKLITRTPFNRKIYERMSVLQYAVMQVFLVTMLSLPVKILIRLLFRIKYVWVTPWFNI